jgi:hypothetical protein
MATTTKRRARAGTAPRTSGGKTAARPAAKRKRTAASTDRAATKTRTKAGRKPKAPAATRGEGDGKHGKVIRDSFTMPRSDYDQIAVLKKRCLGRGLARKKSEILRAGLAALQRLSDDELVTIASTVDPVKTGRPPKKKGKAKGKA